MSGDPCFGFPDDHEGSVRICGEKLHRKLRPQHRLDYRLPFRDGGIQDGADIDDFEDDPLRCVEEHEMPLFDDSPHPVQRDRGRTWGNEGKRTVRSLRHVLSLEFSGNSGAQGLPIGVMLIVALPI